MKTISFEEAKLCPKCGEPGEEIGKSRADKRIVYVQCNNERCVWYNTNWLIQKNEDGTVPVREPGDNTDKQFPTVPGMSVVRAERTIDSDIYDDTKSKRPDGT